MRLFIAIQLSDEMKSSLNGTVHALRKAGVRGSYVPEQNLHLTLAFLGEVPDTAAVREALRTVKFRPFRLSMEGLGNFGNLLWAGLKGSRELDAAVQSVRGALEEAGIAYDRKKFTPHITLIRRMQGSRDGADVTKTSMTVREISLMKSEVKEGKRIYTEIFSIKGRTDKDETEG